jgi:hypothetical protein
MNLQVQVDSESRIRDNLHLTLSKKLVALTQVNKHLLLYVVAVIIDFDSIVPFLPYAQKTS